MIPTKLNVIIPSVGLLDEKARQGAHYVLRNLDIDLTALYEATLAMWTKVSEADPIDLHVMIAHCFEETLGELNLDFKTETKVINVIDRTIQRLSQSFGSLLLPILNALFEHRMFTLRLKDTTEDGDLVIEISEVTQTDEITNPSLPSYPPDG